MSKTFSHSQLYNYCHELFREKLSALDKNGIHPAILQAKSNKLFYWYPPTNASLLKIINDDKLLSDKGWVPGFYNSPFIIWYRNNSSIQCIPVDLKTASMVKSGSLNTDIPFGYRWVRVVSDKQKNEPIYVTADPVVASLMIDRGYLVVAMGGDFVPHAHEKHLVALNKPLIYLNNKQKKDAAFKFVTTLQHYNCEISVVLVDDVKLLLCLGDDDFKQRIKSNEIEGCDFVVNRIMTKRRNTEGMSIHEEISRLVSQSTDKYQQRYKGLFQHQTINAEHINYANACYLMSELINAKMSVTEASEVVKRRYQININITPAGGI
ncbi:hypothetical protein ACV4QK_20660 (plasmid) [Alteromonas macleodii]